MTPFKSFLIVLFFLFPSATMAQEISSNLSFLPNSITIVQDEVVDVYPDPKSVLRKSLIVPGWGQITNKQAWKVPIVYGLLGGLTYYSISLTKDYHDYRAAFYNLSNDDFRFGQTPAYLDGITSQSLKSQRNFLRNRRDFIYVTIALAYALNAIDAYVFAHLRSFDVSDDLSLRPEMKPDIILTSTDQPIPALSLSISF
ncbi:MAG: hypothetical protein ED557_03190 [Balneola sp.]|nr:MAG: hypothetical protein ED557_03190 [Balneola sp.]